MSSSFLTDFSARLRRLRAAAWRLRWRCDQLGRRLLRLKRTTYIDDRVAEYRAYWEASSKRLGAAFEPIGAKIWEVRRETSRTRIASHIVQIDGPDILRLAADKPYCSRLADRLGIPIARHWLFRLAEVDLTNERDFPCTNAGNARSASKCQD